MRIPLMCVAIATLAACTSAKPLMAPSGSQGFKVWCEITSQCYEKAAKVCPNGYTIEADQKDYWGLGDIDGNLIIVCKHPGQASAAPNAVAPPSNGASPSPAPYEPDPAKRCDACQKLGNH